MKKLILFLLLPLWAIAQTSTGQEQEFDYGIKNNSTQTITTPPYLTTTGMDGTQGKIPSALIEKTDNKQNSLAIDGTGTKYPTVDAVNAGLLLKQNALNWKTPQDYGAIGDGITDDTAAIQACFLANKNVLLYGTYKISDYIELFDDQFVFSNNATITRNTSLATSMLAAIDRFGIQIKGALTLVGGGNSAGLAAGISFAGCDNVQIDGVVFKDISGTALNLENSAGTTLPRGDGCLVSNIQFFNCYTGLYVEALAEYHSFININATACNTGLIIRGGNISITSGSISDNVNGVYLGGSFTTNNSHGVLNGLQINHNALNLKVENAEFGETIQGCHFYGDVANNIEIIDSKGLIFSNCTIDGKVYNSDSIIPNGSHLFSDCLIEPSTSFVGSNMLIKNCITRTGGAYIDNNYDVKGINHPVGTSWNDFGNMNIYSNDAFAINKGGSLSLGGVYNSTGGIASFAKIHGKAETSTTGSLDGYMAFEVSNNSIAPYSREVGRFSSLGDFSVLRNISATSYTGSATLTGTPTAPTAAPGTTGNQIATTAFVQTEISNNTVSRVTSPDVVIANGSTTAIITLASNASYLGHITYLSNKTRFKSIIFGVGQEGGAVQGAIDVINDPAGSHFSVSIVGGVVSVTNASGASQTFKIVLSKIGF